MIAFVDASNSLETKGLRLLARKKAGPSSTDAPSPPLAVRATAPPRRRSLRTIRRQRLNPRQHRRRDLDLAAHHPPRRPRPKPSLPRKLARRPAEGLEGRSERGHHPDVAKRDRPRQISPRGRGPAPN